MGTAMAIGMARRPPRMNSSVAIPSSRLIRLSVIGVSVVLLAWLSVASALGMIAGAVAPDLALRINPWSASALAAVADRQLASDQPEAAADARRFSKEALEVQAIHPRALRALAFATQNNALADKRVELSARLSRRDIGAQLWLIEERVSAQDAQGALASYDVALRTNRRIADVLFPQLANALTEPVIRKAFLPYLREPPPWLLPFLAVAIQTGSEPKAIAALVSEARGLPKGDQYRGMEKLLIDRLIREGAYRAALSAYRAVPGYDPQLLVSPRLRDVDASKNFGSLSWVFYTSPAIGAEIMTLPDTKAPMMRVLAGPGERQIVASKVLFLPPGTHSLRWRLSNVDASKGSSASWSVNCGFGAGAGELSRGADILNRSALGAREYSFTVTPDCPAQQLLLTVTGGTGQNDMRFDIGDLKLSGA